MRLAQPALRTAVLSLPTSAHCHPARHRSATGLDVADQLLQRARASSSTCHRAGDRVTPPATGQGHGILPGLGRSLPAPLPQGSCQTGYHTSCKGTWLSTGHAALGAFRRPSTWSLGSARPLPDALLSSSPACAGPGAAVTCRLFSAPPPYSFKNAPWISSFPDPAGFTSTPGRRVKNSTSAVCCAASSLGWLLGAQFC